MTGYGVEIKFCVFEKENALKVPSSAVFSDGDGDFVYLAKGGKAVKTAVEVEYKAGDTAVILSGIKEGDKVVKSADSEDVFDGARIRAK
jgi:HlyD family secretion protein